ncbi:MAG: hypothetical protein RDU13_05525 [Elusimicrobiales bacterium]|jgi:hypothetical protein|nr:hypothetical protein [Elusimicrobiales bacterium]
MKKLTAIAVLMSFAFPLSAQVNFDQGVDVKAFVAEASSAEIALPESKMTGIPTYSSRDCKKVEFKADSPLTSADIKLSSMEMYQDCHNIGYPVGQICTPRPQYYNETTRVIITEPRELKPDQKEVFEVCLWGPFLTIKPVESVYKYKSRVTFDGIYMTPKGLIETAKSVSTGRCTLAMDAGNTCIYRCPEGNYISRPNPFPPIPAPNQWVGPIHTPCAPTAQQTPFGL